METTLNILNSAGAQAGVYEVKADFLEAEKGDQVVHDVVVAFLAKLRAGTASTKTKGDVSGGGRKPWKSWSRSCSNSLASMNASKTSRSAIAP